MDINKNPMIAATDEPSLNVKQSIVNDLKLSLNGFQTFFWEIVSSMICLVRVTNALFSHPEINITIIIFQTKNKTLL